ncbi:hypothetical protein [Eisenibacter elegans]|jgi:acetolactate synthase regulatory subunit|uniref:hypothetical protein n=1 Tax=Eisenibacter elegans TaxID=997 RepID=UPI000405FD71|nr:hypothetical protein [Eisenibacter elegans]
MNNAPLSCSILLEQRVELINRILMILNRRRIAVQAFAAHTDEQQRYRLELTITTTEALAQSTMRQIRKQIGVMSVLLTLAQPQEKSALKALQPF